MVTSTATTVVKLIDRSGLVYGLAGLCALTLSIISISDFLACDFVTMRSSKNWSTESGYTPSQFWSLVIATVSLPISIIFLLVFAVQSFKNRWSMYGKLGAYFVVTCYAAVGMTAAYHKSSELLSCGVFCLGTREVDKNDTNDAAVIVVGMIYFCVFMLLFVVFLYILLQTNFAMDDNDDLSSMADLALNLNEDDDDVESEERPLISTYGISVSRDNHVAAPGSGSRDQQPRTFVDSPMVMSTKRQRQMISTIALVFIFLFPLLITASALLPTWWAYFTLYDIRAYEASVPASKYGPYWLITMAESVQLKIYPDIILFYGAIYGISLVSLAANFIEPLRRRLIAKPAFLVGFCVGEILLFITFFGLLLLEFVYWYYFHGWENTAVSSRSRAERGARTIGQLTNVAVGFLVLPVTRNSVWTHIFGLSFESMIRFHQYIGYCVLALITTHGLLWWVVFAEEGTFPHDIFAIPSTFHTVVYCLHCFIPLSSNFALSL
jgi:hypothetical protein